MKIPFHLWTYFKHDVSRASTSHTMARDWLQFLPDNNHQSWVTSSFCTVWLTPPARQTWPAHVYYYEKEISVLL